MAYIDREKGLSSMLENEMAKSVEFDERKKKQENGSGSGSGSSSSSGSGSGSSSDEVNKKRRAFIDNLMGWIEDHKGSSSEIEKFRLVFSHPEKGNHQLEMERAIQFAIDKNVKSLDLDFSDPFWIEENDEIPRQIFLRLPSYPGHEKLESLMLYSCYLPEISQLQTFSLLKKLSLGWISLPSVSIKNLISKCPVLEFLSLKKCWNLSSLHVIAPRLKTLVVENCFPPSLDIITIKTPNLLSLKYSGEVRTIFVFDEISSEFQEAELNYGVEKKFIEVGDILVEKLYYISSMQTLTVCNYMLKVIHNGEDPLFIKSGLAVKHLILKTALEKEDFYGITFFLRSCPHLERLTIDLVPPKPIKGFEHPFPIQEHQFISSKEQTITIGGSQWQPRLIDCMEKLSTITIKGFKANPDELLVMRYFFKNGSKVLTMYVGIPSGADDDERAKYKKAARSLLMFRRSTNQRLEFF